MTTAALTGASGLVGGNLAELLIKDGVVVRATRRASTRIDHLKNLDIHWVHGDLDDQPALARAFLGVDVVFHCAGYPTQTHRQDGPHRKINVEGTKHVVAACKEAKVKRLVHVSSVVACAIARPGEPDVDETAPYNFHEFGLDEIYSVTKREAEEAVLAAKGDLDVVVVNPGLMFGPRDSKPSSGRLMLELSAGRIMVSSSGTCSVADVRDVCRGMIAAWKKGRRGQRYILSGDNMPYKDLLAMISRALGVRGPRVMLPDLAVSIAGRFGDLGEKLLRREMPLNSGVTGYATCEGYRYSSKKAEQELGYTHGSIEAAIRDSVAWMRAKKMLN